MIDKSDLIIAVGFDPIEIDYEDWVGDTRLVHLSSEPVQPGTRVDVLYEAVGDLGTILREIEDIPSVENAWDSRLWEEHRERFAKALRPKGYGFAAFNALDVLRAELSTDAILTYDVGAHTHQIASQWSTDLPHTAVATNGWSSMGYGMPSAFAAKLVHPERDVICVVGDGGFQMTAGELATARRLGLRVPVVVLDDGWLGLMKIKQERLGYPGSASPLGERVDPPTHYFGVPVRVAKNEGELAEAVRWGLEQDGPTVIETFIDVEAYSKTVFD
jgi:acetolactate synthase-1/2/3 large subunit